MLDFLQKHCRWKVLGGRWKVLGGGWKVLGGSAISNVLCSVKNCVGLPQWKTVIKVFLASNLSEKQPDYTVELKKISVRDYTILHGTQPMSKVCVQKIFALLIRWLILNIILKITQPSWKNCYRCVMLLINLIHIQDLIYSRY